METNRNILLIHADQLRWDCLSLYGNDEVKTPHLDELARQSRVFDNHFCSYPVCTPSRYTLLTGLDVQDHGGWTNHSTLKADIPTWPKLLKGKGYRCTAVGKMHFTPTYLDVGFDTMLLCEQDGPGRWDDDYHGFLMDRDLIDDLDLEDQRQEYRQKADEEYWSTLGSRSNILSAEHTSSGWIASRACEKLNGWNESGECLMVGFVKPHHPFDPPVPWSSLYDPEKLTLLPGWTDEPSSYDYIFDKGYFDHAELTPEAVKRVMAMYYGSISEIDAYVGEMIRTLKEKGLYENTLIIFTSDHGDYMGYHHMLLKNNHMYDPLMRIPLIIKEPFQAERLRSDALSGNGDLCDYIIRTVGGKDVQKCSLLQGQEYVFAHAQEGGRAMVRSKTHKLLWNNEDNTGELFNLSEDPLETTDCSIVEQNEFLQLRTALDKWQKAGPGQSPYLNYDAMVCPSYNPTKKRQIEARIDYFNNRFQDIRS